MRCKNLKKRKALSLIGLTLLLTVGCSRQQGETQPCVSHSFYWGGTICSGTYTGEMEGGRPYGKGTFQGHVMRDGKELDEVSYTGSWKEGRLAGKGTFTNISEDISYQGKFMNNTKHGDFVVKTGGSDTYEKVSFRKDIPCGVSILYSTEDDSITGYDRYYKGIRVSDILADAKEFSYADLIYDSDEHAYEEIALDCQVEEKTLREVVISEEDDSDNEEIETELRAEWKVKDAQGNFYLVSYNAEYPQTAENYMPDVDEGEKIRVYGYFKGISSVEEDSPLTARYPLIEGVTAGKEGSTIQMGQLPMEYKNFLDYPYEYQGSTVSLSGIVRHYGTDMEGQFFVLIESESYAEGDQNIYACAFDMEDKEKLKGLPETGGQVTVTGELDRVYLIPGEKGFELYPKIVITEISAD